MKTAELASGLIYATKDRPSLLNAHPSLLLDTALWRTEDAWGNWDGAKERSKRRIVRKAPQGARVETNTSWGFDYRKTALPLLVLKVCAWDFSERAGDNQIVESPASILERARDHMNIMALVDEDHDGRVTESIRHNISIRVETVKGVARKVEVELELMRPQQILSQWGPYAKQEAREAEAKEAAAKATAERKNQATEQSKSLSARLNTLLERDTTQRSGFRRQWTSSGTSTTYEVSAEIIERLLDLAEKGSIS